MPASNNSQNYKYDVRSQSSALYDVYRTGVAFHQCRMMDAEYSPGVCRGHFWYGSSHPYDAPYNVLADRHRMQMMGKPYIPDVHNAWSSHLSSLPPDEKSISWVVLPVERKMESVYTVRSHIAWIPYLPYQFLYDRNKVWVDRPLSHRFDAFYSLDNRNAEIGR